MVKKFVYEVDISFTSVVKILLRLTTQTFFEFKPDSSGRNFSIFCALYGSDPVRCGVIQFYESPTRGVTAVLIKIVNFPELSDITDFKKVIDSFGVVKVRKNKLITR